MADIKNTPDGDQTPKYAPDGLDITPSTDYKKALSSGFKSEQNEAVTSPSPEWQLEDNRKMGLGNDSGEYVKKGTGTP